MNFTDFLKDNIVRLDGGMGTLLQAKGLTPGEHPERWNVTHPETIVEIHREYYDAGSNVICTNTFGANCLKFSEEELETLIRAAVDNAKAARDASDGKQHKYIALDIGPTGKLLKPLGDLDFEDAVEVFAKTVRIGAACGVDLILIETMNDSYETKAALLAAKESCDLPVLVSNAYGEDGKLMTGATPAAMVAMLEGLGADAIGANCSLGPGQLRSVIKELLSCASVPVILKPNAGLPKVVNGATVYDVDAEASIGRANERIKRSTEEAFASTVQGYSSVIPVSSNIHLQNGRARYALYPVWILNTQWNGQKFTFGINGQTGKIAGDLPMDKGAFRRWLFGVSAAAAAVVFGLSYLFWML